LLLVVSGALLLHARTLPCPADPRAARACNRLRRISNALYGVAAVAPMIGALFAFVLPRLQA
jgi:hypothetical protein